MPHKTKTATRRGGPGRGQGNKRRLPNARPAKFMTDDNTEAALKKIHPDRSRAIRILAGTDVPMSKAEEEQARANH